MSIWTLTANDVHPPLYYWIIKSLSSIFGDNITTYRVSSAIPILLVVVLASTTIRKTWGNKTAIFFILLILLHFSIQIPMGEMRMYAWAMFFVLVAYISAYKLYNCPNWKYTVLLTVSAMAAAYTHYYALFAVVFIFLSYIIQVICNRKNPRYWIIASIFCIIIYTPWLTILLSQAVKVSNDYWIGAIYRYQFTVFFNPFGRLVGAILIILIAFSLRNVISNWRLHKSKISQIIILYVIACMPIILGLIYSYLTRPVLLPRYFYCTILLIFLGTAQLFSLSDLKNRINQVIYVIFFLALGWTAQTKLSNLQGWYKSEDAEYAMIDEFLANRIDHNTAFVYNQFPRIYVPETVYLYPNNKHILRIKGPEMPLFLHDSISSYTEISPKYDKICIINLSDAGLLEDRKDSAMIVQEFDIVDRFQTPRRIVHILTRKEKDASH